jgi:hypothetical protein
MHIHIRWKVCENQEEAISKLPRWIHILGIETLWKSQMFQNVIWEIETFIKWCDLWTMETSQCKWQYGEMGFSFLKQIWWLNIMDFYIIVMEMKNSKLAHSKHNLEDQMIFKWKFWYSVGKFFFKCLQVKA